MNEDIRLSKGLGLFSIGLGVVEVVASRRIVAALGLPVPAAVVAMFGVRQLAAGFTALAHPDNVGPMGMRLAGDALDLAVLGGALLPGNMRRPAAVLATAAVLGLTMLDLAAAGALRRRSTRALETARRTRVRQIA